MASYFADTASIDPRAQIDDEVEIGPFCVIGPQVRIGRGTRLENSVTLMGNVAIGCYNHIYPNAVIGGEPQDITYGGSDTKVIIGDHNIIRECVTINRASEKEEGVTRVGDHNFLMACSHVAHDCQLGNHIIVANGSLLAGHVHVHDHASLSGTVAVHQFATIGSYSFVAGLSACRNDVPPYMLVEGYPARPRCINASRPETQRLLPASHRSPRRSPPPALPLESRPGKRLGNPPRQRPSCPASQPPAKLCPRPARRPARPRPRTPPGSVKSGQ